MKLRKLYDQVEICLKNFEETRNSDIELTHRIWKEFYPGQIQYIGSRPAVYLDSMFDLPREDNVKRVRANIQNVEKRFVPTDWKVAQARGFKVKAEWESFLGYDRDSQIVIVEGKKLDKEFNERLFDLPPRMY